MDCAVIGLRMDSGAVCSVIATSCSFVHYTQQIGHLGQVRKDWVSSFLLCPYSLRHTGADDNWILVPPEAAQNPCCRASQSFQQPSMMCTTSQQMPGLILLLPGNFALVLARLILVRHNIPYLVAKSSAGTLSFLWRAKRFLTCSSSLNAISWDKMGTIAWSFR